MKSTPKGKNVLPSQQILSFKRGAAIEKGGKGESGRVDSLQKYTHSP